MFNINMTLGTPLPNFHGRRRHITMPTFSTSNHLQLYGYIYSAWPTCKHCTITRQLIKGTDKWEKVTTNNKICLLCEGEIESNPYYVINVFHTILHKEAYPCLFREWCELLHYVMQFEDQKYMGFYPMELYFLK